MTSLLEKLTTTLESFGAENPTQVAQTRIATIWKVELADRLAALKLYHTQIGDERPGLTLLAAKKGQGAVEIYAHSDDAVLMEWLEGPTLAPIKDDASDDAMCRILGQVANDVQSGPSLSGLRPLEDQLQALLCPNVAEDLPKDISALFDAARMKARCLMSETRDKRPLHGDLHHGNVILSPRGPVAIDPKGLVGDRAYDLANVFKNPTGRPDLFARPDRINARAEVLANETGLNTSRLLGWAFVHCAISILWDGRVSAHPLLAHLDGLRRSAGVDL